MPTTSPTVLLVDSVDLLGLMWAADHALQIASKRMHARLGVTGRQRVAIRLIGRAPGIAPSDLSELLHIDRSTLTGILFRLESAGLVRRVRHERDGRRASLFLTARGEEINAVQKGTIEACLQDVLTGVAPGSIAGCAEVLRALTEKLTNDAY